MRPGGECSYAISRKYPVFCAKPNIRRGGKSRIMFPEPPLEQRRQSILNRVAARYAIIRFPTETHSATHRRKLIYTSDTSRTPTPKRPWRRRLRIIKIMTTWPKEMGAGVPFRDQAMPRTSMGANRTHPRYHYRENETKYITSQDINLFRKWESAQTTVWHSSLTEALWRGLRRMRSLVRRRPSIFQISRRRRSNPPSKATRYGPREVKSARS